MGKYCRTAATVDSETATQPRCGVCGDELASGVIACASCGAAHHLSCWEFVGHCSAYGCGEERGVTLNAVAAVPSGQRPPEIRAPAKSPAQIEAAAELQIDELMRAMKAAQVQCVKEMIDNFEERPTDPRASLFAWSVGFMLFGILAFWVHWALAVVLLLISAALNPYPGQ